MHTLLDFIYNARPHSKHNIYPNTKVPEYPYKPKKLDNAI